MKAVVAFLVLCTVEDAELDGTNGRLSAIGHAQLRQDLSHLVFGRAPRKADLCPNFPICPPGCQKSQNMPLAVRQT